MENKLWSSAPAANESHADLIGRFTAGKDRTFDLLLAEHDVIGSIAHAQMLGDVGLITNEEWLALRSELSALLREIRSGGFALEEGVEDIHSQVELILTRKLGETGKKIHTGRSRNDQVLLDIKLFLRAQLVELTKEARALFDRLISLSERHAAVLLPGYTHMQLAMPSSFGLWFGAYAESLTDDLELLNAAYRTCNRNPLGSAAGFGSPFPIDRALTTSLLGFAGMNYNVVYAQMTRGKTERTVSFALAALAATVGKLSHDICAYMGQSFVSFPASLTTGSSIMPHKKNPDVFELIRGRCNRVQAVPNELALLMTNLPSGYHREMQLTKEILFPAISELLDCMRMTTFMLGHIRVNDKILDDAKYDVLFSVEEVNREVLRGASFRDAYHKVAADIADGSFKPDRRLQHTLAGGMQNLCNDEIAKRFAELCAPVLGE